MVVKRLLATRPLAVSVVAALLITAGAWIVMAVQPASMSGTPLGVAADALVGQPPLNGAALVMATGGASGEPMPLLGTAKPPPNRRQVPPIEWATGWGYRYVWGWCPGVGGGYRCLEYKMVQLDHCPRNAAVC